mmetsp:Transcript_56945/g.161670  ORF Transcript_56945/g.161670 Transcript_56945/m.161670 type:complete len:242 (-) Transcript_56945:98-823(-)
MMRVVALSAILADKGAGLNRRFPTWTPGQMLCSLSTRSTRRAAQSGAGRRAMTSRLRCRASTWRSRGPFSRPCSRSLTSTWASTSPRATAWLLVLSMRPTARRSVATSSSASSSPPEARGRGATGPAPGAPSGGSSSCQGSGSPRISAVSSSSGRTTRRTATCTSGARPPGWTGWLRRATARSSLGSSSGQSTAWRPSSTLQRKTSRSHLALALSKRCVECCPSPRNALTGVPFVMPLCVT